MRTVRLGDIAESLPCSYGEEPINNEPTFDVVKVSNVSPHGQLCGEFELRSFRSTQIPDLLVREGELLVVKSSGSKANILSGKTAICSTDCAGRIVASNFLLRLRVDKSVALPRFIWYVLNSGRSKAFVKTIVGASTYPNLKWSLYSSHPVPLPPLSEQRRIAEILDKADALLAKRRAALAQLGTVTPSLFLDMFGDPATNPKGWPVCQLQEVVKAGTIITYGIVQAGEECPGGVPYIRTGDIVNGEIVRDGLRHTDPAIAAKFTRSRVQSGDIVMSIRATVGTTALVPSDLDGANLTQGTAKIAPGGQVEGPYLLHLLRAPGTQHWISRQIKGVTFREITLGRLRELPVMVPPIECQRDFARWVEAVDGVKSCERSSLADIQALVASLKYRAFRGEL